MNIEAEGTYTTTRPDVRPHSASIAIMMLLPPPAHEAAQTRPPTLLMPPAATYHSAVAQSWLSAVWEEARPHMHRTAHACQNLTSGTIQVQPRLFARLHQLYQVMHALPEHDKICLSVR
jgi:hypothetical protein